jgi:class 3 adenylate cyclase
MPAHDDRGIDRNDFSFGSAADLIDTVGFVSGREAAALEQALLEPQLTEPADILGSFSLLEGRLDGASLVPPGPHAIMLCTAIRRQFMVILMADVVGYTRLLEQDEIDTALRVQRLRRHLVEPVAHAHDGAIVDHAGDGTLMSFSQSANAVRCAVVIQRELQAAERDVAAERRIRLRMGIAADEVIVIDDAVYGRAVNVAARLQTLADPGGIYLSSGVLDRAQSGIGIDCEVVGRRRLRNIAQPVRVYRVARSELLG